MRRLQWDFDAWEDYISWQTHDKKILKNESCICILHML